MLTCEHNNHFNVDNNSFNLYKFNICHIRNKRTVIDKEKNWNLVLLRTHQSFTKYVRLTPNFMLNSALRKRFDFYSSTVLC